MSYCILASIITKWFYCIVLHKSAVYSIIIPSSIHLLCSYTVMKRQNISAKLIATWQSVTAVFSYQTNNVLKFQWGQLLWCELYNTVHVYIPCCIETEYRQLKLLLETFSYQSRSAAIGRITVNRTITSKKCRQKIKTFDKYIAHVTA